jgi:hypothetical protein
MTRIIDDFAAIRARLAELRGETPSGGALEFNADELIIVSEVSVPLSSLRIEAELDADAYKRGAAEVAAANRRMEEEAFRCTPALLEGIAQLRALYPVEPKRRVPVYRAAAYDSGWVECTGWAALEAAEPKRRVPVYRDGPNGEPELVGAAAECVIVSPGIPLGLLPQSGPAQSRASSSRSLWRCGMAAPIHWMRARSRWGSALSRCRSRSSCRR